MIKFIKKIFKKEQKYTVVDLTNSTASTINELRQAFKKQKEQEQKCN